MFFTSNLEQKIVKYWVMHCQFALTQVIHAIVDKLCKIIKYIEVYHSSFSKNKFLGPILGKFGCDEMLQILLEISEIM